MESKLSAMFSKYIVTYVLSLGATILSFLTLFGCDYVRLNFAALTDSSTYFTDPSRFGLGFLTHQNFDQGKNLYSWSLDSTCHSYDSLAIDMFRSSSLRSSFALAISSAGCSTAVLFLTILTIFYTGRECFTVHAITILLSILSAVYQLIAMFITFGENSGGVCDPSSYGDNWYKRFPWQDYREVEYMKYFSECTVGSTFYLSLAVMITELAVTASIVVGLYLNYKSRKEAESKTTREISFPLVNDETNKVEENTSPLIKNQEIDIDVEAGPNENQPDISLSSTSNQDKIENDDDVSYDEEESLGNVEDKIGKEDDIEIAPDNISSGDTKKEAEASVGTVKMFSMKSGRF